MENPKRAFRLEGWRPDVRTVGLLIAGFFGVITVGFCLRAADLLFEAVNGLPPGLPPDVPLNSLGSNLLHLSTAQRVDAASTFVGGVALGEVAISGWGLVAALRGCTLLAIGGLAIAASAQLTTTIATVVDEQTRLYAVEAATILVPALTVVGYSGLILVLLGRIPRLRFAATGSESRSWMEDAADDAGYERAP